MSVSSKFAACVGLSLIVLFGCSRSTSSAPAPQSGKISQAKLENAVVEAIVPKNNAPFIPAKATFGMNPDIVLVQCRDRMTTWFRVIDGRLAGIVVADETLHVKNSGDTQPERVVVPGDIVETQPFLAGDRPYVTHPLAIAPASSDRPQKSFIDFDSDRFPLPAEVGAVYDATTIDGQAYVLASNGIFKAFADGSFEQVKDFTVGDGYFLSSSEAIVIENAYTQLSAYDLQGNRKRTLKLDIVPGIGKGEPYWDFTLGPNRRRAFVISTTGYILSSDGELYETGDATAEWQFDGFRGRSFCLVDDRHGYLHVFKPFGDYTSIQYRSVPQSGSVE